MLTIEILLGNNCIAWLAAGVAKYTSKHERIPNANLYVPAHQIRLGDTEWVCVVRLQLLLYWFLDPRL
jgi:hypothetical protein